MEPLGVKEAVEAAHKYIIEIGILKMSDLRLEEVEPSLDEREYRITLSGLTPVSSLTKSGADLSSVFGPSHERIYKVFTVDKKTGKVLSMKMR